MDTVIEASEEKLAGDALLRVEGLKTSFFTPDGEVRAVNGVSLTLSKGRTLGIVGESGCGKSLTALSVMRLVPDPPGRIIGGEVLFEGEDLLKASNRRMRAIRGSAIAMIFQEPMTSLNQVYTVGAQIIENIRLHTRMSRREARARAIEMLKLVGIPAPERRVDDYPHHLSGGMRQRVMIAMALSCNPRLLIADEPTTALDVTIQAQILELMQQLQQDFGTAVMLITHDLGVIAETAHEVAVMYLGEVVELCDVDELFENPRHPYTIGLLSSVPTIGQGAERLAEIEGSVPAPLDAPAGCPFHPRCPMAIELCRQQVPQFRELRPNHWVKCWRAEP